MALSINVFTFNYFAENTYLLYDETGECVIIDPGTCNLTEENQLTEFISENGLRPVLLLNTHCHIDHILGNAMVAEKYGLELVIHREDLPVLRSGVGVSLQYGIPYKPSPEPTRFLEEGDVISFGNQEMDIIFIPGHSPGSIGFVHHTERFVIAGDVLFQGSIGRTDLPGGDMHTLVQSIQNKLYTLPDDYTVLPGHGPQTTIGIEKLNNPFVRVSL